MSLDCWRGIWSKRLYDEILACIIHSWIIVVSIWHLEKNIMFGITFMVSLQISKLVTRFMSYRFILLLSVLQLYNTNAWPFLMLTISAIYNSAITIYAIVHQRDYKATSCPWNECVQRNKKWKALFYFAFRYCWNFSRSRKNLRRVNLVDQQFLLNAFLLGKDYSNLISRTINLLLRGTFETLVFIAFMGNTSKVL